MASLYLRGKIYWVKIYRKGRKPLQVSTGKEKKSEAKTEAIKIEARIQGTSYGDSKLRFLTLLEDLQNDYIINRRKSIKDLTYKLDAFLMPYFGSMLVTDVTPGVIQDYVRQRIEKDKVKNGTINRELSYILRAFNLGALNGRVSFVPKIRKLKEAPPRTDSYTEEDCIELYKKLPDYIQAIVIFANYTGWRRSEIIRIKKEHVDLEKNEVWIPPGESKNEQSRIIAMSPKVREVIKERLSSSGACAYVFHRRGKAIKSFRTAWERARKEAKLEDKTFHAFRRTAAMRFDAKGISTRVIMEMMGHKTRAMFDNYRRVASKEIHEAVKLLEEDKKE